MTVEGVSEGMERVQMPDILKKMLVLVVNQEIWATLEDTYDHDTANFWPFP